MSRIANPRIVRDRIATVMNEMSLVIAPADTADLRAIAALLSEASLPHEDFAAHLAHFLVARRGGELIGVIGAELHGADALLRSLAVIPTDRGVGLGGRLVEEIERAGAEWGVKQWWLLTTTAEAFFARRGFTVVPRTQAPPSIASTQEFRDLCPASAVFMSRPAELS